MIELQPWTHVDQMYGVFRATNNVKSTILQAYES